jgi:hypothetical protein
MASTAVAVAAGRAATRVQYPQQVVARARPAAARPLHRPATLPRRSATAHLPARILPRAIFVLKLLAGALAGVTLTAPLWDNMWKRPKAPHVSIYDSALYSGQQEIDIKRQERSTAGWEPPWYERGVPENYPRRVHLVIFTPQTRQVGAPVHVPERSASVNPLSGKPLRYLIGTDSAGTGHDNEVTEVSYNATAPVKRGISIAYGNLFDERNTGRYGPYLHTSDTAKQYNEGQIDPRGAGWEKNLREQFERRKKQGFEYIELDNPDAYSSRDVIGAMDLAASYGLKIIAKNPLLVKGAVEYVAHPNVYAIIVEKGAGNPREMDALRKKAGKPDLPVWFVAFGSGRSWAGSIADAAKQHRHMGVTYSSAGEYGNAIDIVVPPAERSASAATASAN